MNEDGSRISPPLRKDDPHGNPLSAMQLSATGQPGRAVSDDRLMQAQEPGAKEYFLGVSCAPLTEDLRSSLKVDEQQGLVVMDVIPDSPAAVGGVQKGDILVAVGERELAEVGDLIAAVGAAAGNDMKITLARDGQRQDVSVTPKKRRDINFNMPIPGAVRRSACKSSAPAACCRRGWR